MTINFKNAFKSVLGVVSVVAISTGISASAQANSTVTLTVNAGALTMYAPDGNDNNDFCASETDSGLTLIADDGSETSGYDCSTNTELGMSLSDISVQASRQLVSGSLDDVLFEDLSGNGDQPYSVTLSGITDLQNGGSGSDIVLGSNPDGASSDSATGAPSTGAALYAYVDQTGGTIKGITPEGVDNTDFSTGSTAQTITAAGDPSVDIFSTGGTSVNPGRYDLDGLEVYYRIPAYVDAGTYTSTLTFTVAAS
jgi:hypothetical protein